MKISTKTLDVGIGQVTYEGQDFGAFVVPGHCPLNGSPVKSTNNPNDKSIDPCQKGCPYFCLSVTENNIKRTFTCGKIALDAASLLAITMLIPNALKGLTGIGEKISKHPLLGAFFK